MTIRERWSVDGYELTEGAVRDVEYRSGQLGTPALRGDNATVAHRTGTLWRPKVHEAGAFTLEVWFGEDQRTAQAQWDEILRAVVSPHRLCTWSRVTAAGEVRSCAGEVTAALQPTAIGQAAYRAQIEVTVPSGYWRGERMFTASTSTEGSPATGAGGLRYRDVALTGLAPSTAPMEELVLRLDGHLVGPQVLDVTLFGRGERLQYALTIPAGRGLELDCRQWVGTGIGGLTFEAEALSYTGHRYLTVAAAPPGVVPTVRLAASSMGAGARLTVSGYRSYLC